MDLVFWGEDLNIVLMGTNDWAGLGYNLYEALNREGVNCRHIVGRAHGYGYKYDILATDEGLIPEVSKILDDADYILYLGSDWHYQPLGIKADASIPKGVWHVGSSYRNQQDFYDRLKGFKYFFGTGMTGCQADYIFLPALIDTSEYAYQDRNWSDKLIIGHSPSTVSAKATDVFIEAMEGLDAEIDVIHGVSYDECMIRKRRCHVFFDQLWAYKLCNGEVPGYGMSAVEAGAYGSIVLGGSELLGIHCTRANLRSQIESVINAPVAQKLKWSKDIRKYVVEMHGYEAVVKGFLDGIK